MEIRRLIIKILLFILDLFGVKPNPEQTEAKINFDTFATPDFFIRGVFTMAELREGKSAVVTAAPKTAAGNPAAYQTGSAVFESSDETVLRVTQNPDNELEATLEALDGSNNETVTVTFTADGDPDADEERMLVGSIAVSVTQGEAIAFDLTFSTVQPETPENPETPGENPGS